MNRRGFFLISLIFFGSCFKRHDDNVQCFLSGKCAIVHSTPKGVIWAAYGPTAPNALGLASNIPDGLLYTDVAGISLAIDASVDALQAKWPTVAVWAAALALPWFIVDDYAFPDCGAVDGTTGYASGLTETSGGAAVLVCFALWSRHSLNPGDPQPSGIPAPWCLRGPGQNGYDYWRYGDFPMLPAVQYEFEVNVLRLVSGKSGSSMGGHSTVLIP